MKLFYSICIVIAFALIMFLLQVSSQSEIYLGITIVFLAVISVIIIKRIEDF